MPVHLLRGVVGGQAVLLEDRAIAETTAFDAGPDPLELAPASVFQFQENLAHLCQGVTGLALVDDACLPIVSAGYFRTDRAPAAGVHTIDRSHVTQPENAGARRFFVFGVPGAAGFQFALSMAQVLEVSRPLPVAPLNFEYSHFAGAAVWRGETIPVIDLAFAARLGAMRRETCSRMVIVRNRNNRIFTIPASGTVRQPGVPSQVYAPDSVSVRPMRGIRGVFRFEGSPLLVPDLDALLD
ncbi:MAG TPA: chemotaxis protein CheW [Bryobacteraceae bacterium]|jgi:chemotaxis signal transduction protein